MPFGATGIRGAARGAGVTSGTSPPPARTYERDGTVIPTADIHVKEVVLLSARAGSEDGEMEEAA